MTTRDTIRASIFSAENKRFKTEIISFYGQEIEIRQPSLGQILDAQQTDDRRQAVVNIMVGFCYVPGTDEKVFEVTDKDLLMTMPFGDDFLKVNKAIERLTNVNVLDQEGNSGRTQTGATS